MVWGIVCHKVVSTGSHSLPLWEKYKICSFVESDSRLTTGLWFTCISRLVPRKFRERWFQLQATTVLWFFGDANISFTQKQWKECLLQPENPTFSLHYDDCLGVTTIWSDASVVHKCIQFCNVLMPYPEQVWWPLKM